MHAGGAYGNLFVGALLSLVLGVILVQSLKQGQQYVKRRNILKHAKWLAEHPQLPATASLGLTHLLNKVFFKETAMQIATQVLRKWMSHFGQQVSAACIHLTVSSCAS